MIANPLIELWRGDITKLEVDAIANAANAALAGGGGVDGAIHRAAGPELMRELRARYPDGCPTGSAVITGAGRLRAKYVIHAVGPIWHGGDRNEDALLAAAYRAVLDLAQQHGARTVAFPSISTGVYGFPVERAAPLALGAARAYAAEHPAAFDRLTWALFDERTLQAFRQALDAPATR